MLNLLTATGRLSKTFGPYGYNNTWYPGYKFRAQGLTVALGIDNSMSDGLLRMLKIPVSSTDYPKINETMRLIMIKPFAAGINYYLYTHWNSLPSWIKENVPVTGEDIASMGALINFLFSNEVLTDWMSAEAKIREMGVIPYLNYYQGASGPHSLSMGTLNSDRGSNEWVVNNTLSDTGFPMLGTNPHLEWDGVTQWHMAHLMAPAQGTLPPLNVYGVIFYGLPFIGIGHNDYLSWMSTVNQPDLGDVWIEQLSTDNTMYKYRGMWVPLRQEIINLPVKIPGIGIVINIPLTTYYTHHGVLLTVNTTDHWALAVNYSSSQNVIGFEQFYLMDTAQNVTQFKTALSKLGVAMFNYMVASVYNETFYVWNAICPVRNDIYNWDYAVPGWESSTDWGGPIPFASLPQQNGTDTGWMQNCNIPCWNITTQPNQITIANETKPFPLYLVNWNWQGMSNHTRGYNMFKILEGATSPISIDTMLGIMGNVSVPYLAMDYIELLPDSGTTDNLNASITDLKAWLVRGAYAWANETAMTIFQLWTQTSGVPNDQSQAVSTLNDTVNYMLAIYGNVSVPWGNVHIVARGDTIIGLNGTDGEPYGCLNPHAALFDNATGYWYCAGGSSFMMVANLELDNVTSWSCLPYGNSNDPNSPHFDDMLKDWYSKDLLHPDFFYMSDILANNESIYNVSVYSLDETFGWFLLLLLLPLLPSFVILTEIFLAQKAGTHLIILGIGGVTLIVVVAVVVIASRRP